MVEKSLCLIEMISAWEDKICTWMVVRAEQQHEWIQCPNHN